MPRPISKQITRVFYTTPRDGYKSGNLWIKRKEEDTLSSLLEAIGVSICIDGPTGTGKSSLAFTVLKQKKINFLILQVTQNMGWKEFCRTLLGLSISNNSDPNEKPKIEALPIFKRHFGINESYTLNDLEQEEKIIARLTDHAICDLLHKSNLTLVIDDFERASDEILSNVGEMCKLFTLSYISQKSKLVIIGTDDIYKRLTSFNKSLEARLKELSIGTISNSADSWQFLIDGFNKLKLKHPQQEYTQFNKITLQEINEIKGYCYDAANGLLKSLNELGFIIAENATDSANRISKATIIQVCKDFFEKNVRLYNQSYPSILKLLQHNTIVKEVIIFLYRQGIGKIHRWDDINEHLDNLEIEQIENAVCDLVKIDFLTRTGYNGEVLFVTNPNLAHTIGVIINNPTKYKLPRSFTLNRQFVLPFSTKEDTL